MAPTAAPMRRPTKKLPPPLSFDMMSPPVLSCPAALCEKPQIQGLDRINSKFRSKGKKGGGHFTITSLGILYIIPRCHTPPVGRRGKREKGAEGGPFVGGIGLDCEVLLAVVGGVLRSEVLPLIRELFLGEDGGYRTHRFTGSAVDAGLGIDVELHGGLETCLFLGGVDAIHRAYFHTGSVLRPDARLSDEVSHSLILLGSESDQRVSSIFIEYSVIRSRYPHRTRPATFGTNNT